MGQCFNETLHGWGRRELESLKEIIPFTFSIFSLPSSSKSFDLLDLFLYHLSGLQPPPPTLSEKMQRPEH